MPLPTLRRTKSDPLFNYQWIVDAPWAHPLWHQYLVTLVDLTSTIEVAPHLERPGVTHEVVVWAVDPAYRLNARDWEQWGEHVHILTPPNHAYQFYAPTDAAAGDRVESLVIMIENGQLNPDTDFRAVWDHLFADGASLRR